MWGSTAQRSQGSTTHPALVGLKGGRIHLYLLPAPGEEPLAHWTGAVERVEPAGLLLKLDGPLLPLEVQDLLVVEGASQVGMVRFETRPLAEPGARSTQLLVALPTEFDLQQRRRFARAPFSGTVHYAFPPATPGGKPVPAGTGVAADLSGGGLRLLLKTPYKPGSELLVSFETPDGRRYHHVRIEVVRMTRQESVYSLGCRFLSLNEAQEAALVQTVFRMQLRTPTL